MSVARYRKRPVEIEAAQWTGDNAEEIQTFTGEVELESGSALAFLPRPLPAQLYVAANDSWLPIERGEWVAKDRHGCYPIKDDVFVETYEKVD